MTTDGVTFENADAADALDVICRLLGAHNRRTGIGDTERFSADLAATSTIRDVLNGIVRAHGQLTWSVTPANTPEFPLNVSLRTVSGGAGVGVPRQTVLGGTTAIRGPIHARGVADSTAPLLDRLVTSERDFHVYVSMSPLGALFFSQIAMAVRAPMGVELAAVQNAGHITHEAQLDGLRLREALSVISAAHPEYEWRELGGTIVFRPRTAWIDADNPLFRVVSGVELYDKPVAEVIDAVLTRLGAAQEVSNSFPDSRHITLVTAQGTVLDLLNALVAAHGQLVWVWEQEAPDERAVMRRQHRLSFHMFDYGSRGYAIP